MGMVADFESVPAEFWPQILGNVVEAGIRIIEVGEQRGCPWCTLSRGRASLGMGHDPSKVPGTIYLWCGALRYWSRPLATRRLLHEVCSIIEASIHQADPESSAAADPCGRQ